MTAPRELYDRAATALGVEDDGVDTEALASIGEIDEALFWLLAAADREHRALPTDLAAEISAQSDELAGAVAALSASSAA